MVFDFLNFAIWLLKYGSAFFDFRFWIKNLQFTPFLGKDKAIVLS